LSKNRTFTEICGDVKLDKIFSLSFRDLLEKHKLIKINNKGITLSPYLCHVLTMQCIQDKTLPVIIYEINTIIPVKTMNAWGHVERHFVARNVHNQLYSGNTKSLKDLVTFNKNPQIIDFDAHSYLIDFCFYPFTEKFFLTLPSQWQYQVFALLFTKQHCNLQDTTETLALLFDLNKRNHCDHDLQLLLAEKLLLNGDINNAEKILLPMSELLSAKADVRIVAYLQALLGWLFFVQENFHQALNYFEQHKVAKNKLARRKRQYIAGIPGIIYSFTLCKLGFDESHQYLTQVVEQEFNYSVDHLNHGFEACSNRTLSSFAKALDDEKHTLTKLTTNFAYTSNMFDLKLNLLISALCHSWLDITPLMIT